MQAQGRRQRQKQSNAIQERPDPCHSAQRNHKIEAHKQRYTVLRSDGGENRIIVEVLSE